MPFEIGELNEWYANIDRVGAENSLDLYQFSRSEAGSFTIGVRSLSAPVSVELLDDVGNVLSAVNASKENGGSFLFEHDAPEDYLLKISSIGGDTPYQVSISPDGESDPITEWGITEGFFVADATGEVGVDFLLDGGKYQGDLAIFSLKGMEDISLGSSEFIREAAGRALTNSELGHTIVSDSLEGAKFSSWNNSGDYLGRKTFAMEPGDVFAAMLVPNGTVQEVYDDPTIEGQKRPLFSLATANPNDAFHVGQVGDITGSGSAFAIEDWLVDTGSDKDYNDVVWLFSGAKGLAMPVGELIAPDKDWRDSPEGQNLLNSIINQPQIDEKPPFITANLTDDTGAENSDRITSDPTIKGKVIESGKIAQFVAGFDALNLTDITDLLSPDGSFTFDRENLETIYGDSLTDGTHTLYLQAADELGNISQVFSLEFRLDTEAPTAIFGLAQSDDTPPVGDGETETSPVTLVGQTEANVEVILLQTGATTTSDETGAFSFSEVSLEIGDNLFEIQVTDAAGNVGKIQQNITRKDPFQPETDPPNISIELAEDTGNDNSDSITSNPAVTGTVSDESAISQFVVGFNPGNLTDVTSDLDETGNFSFNREQLETIFGETLPDGTHTLYLQAVDAEGNLSSIVEFEFTLDTTAPTAIFGLAQSDDTPPVGDGETETSPVTLVGQTEPGLTVTLLSTGATTTSDETGAFSFSEVSLEIGDNLFEIQVTDLAGNVGEVSQNITRKEPFQPETDPPTISIELAEDTGNDNSDSITSNPAVTGTVSDESDISQFVVGFNPGNLTDVTSELDETGNFSFNREKLETIFGQTLPDGTHTLYLQAVDAEGNLSSIVEFEFTLDTTAPTLTVELAASSDTLPIGDGETAIENVTLVGQTEPNVETRYIASLQQTGATTTADENGQFIVEGLTLLPGENSFTIEATDIAGNIGETNYTVTYVLPPTTPDIILTENSDFSTVHSENIEIPQSAANLTFTIADIAFDTNDPDAINDAFEVALVDENGKSLVHTIARERDAFFNWTEGEEILLGTGASYDPESGRVTVNLSEISAGTNATLVFRLVNEDTDTNTTVSINNIALVAATELPPGSLLPQNPPSQGGAISPEQFNRLEDISPSFTPEYGTTSFNGTTKELYADVAIRDRGTYSIDGTLLVAVANISDPTVLVRDPDGFTPEGLPYYNFSHLVEDGQLDPGEISNDGQLVFSNPNQVQFTYDLVVLGQLFSGPTIDSDPVVEIIAGHSYSYDVNASHPTDDVLTYELLSAPEGMEINSETGLISWSPTTEDIANHAIALQVTDSKGKTAKQTFTLSAIATPPNRPPIFTSTPEVDAYINQLYRYDSSAVDPDADPLAYSLIRGPEGMTVDPLTGEVEWTPPPVLVLGDTVLGQVGVPGEKDEFTFSGVKGQKIYFDPLTYSGSSSDWNFKVISPSGKEILDKDLNSNHLLTLNENGNYRVEVSMDNDLVGSYGFSAIDVGMVPFAPFDEVIHGRLSPGSEDDIFRFTGNAGQKLFIDKLSNSGSLDWELYDPGNNSIATSSSFSDLELHLDEDGEYILALRGKAGFTNTADYSFEIITPEEITNPLTLGINENPHSIYGEIGEKGEEDYYTFTGTPGQRIYFDRLFLNPKTSYLTAKIFSPTGKQVLTRNLKDYVTDPDPIILTESGTYRVEIDGINEHTGSYSFGILDMGLATEINLDTSVSGTLDPGQETHLYQFAGSEGQRLFIDSLFETDNTYWKLYDSGNNSIAALTNFNSDIEVLLENDDTYTLAIRGRNGTDPVDYSFSVITPDEHHGEIGSPDGGEINFGQEILGNISEKGERDIYRFSGTKGQRLFLDTLLDTGNIKATIFSPSGTNVINAATLNKDGDRHPVILPESGIYELTIDGNLEATGEYNFQLLDVSNAPAPELLSDNSDSTTGTLTPGKSIQFYQFDVTETQRVYFDSLTDSPSSYWRLYGPGNQEMSYNTSLSRDFEKVLPEGTYYLMLRGEAEETVDYEINLVSTPSDDVESLTWNNENRIEVARDISQLGEQDVYTFSGSVGQTLSFEPLSEDSQIKITVNNPSGKPVISSNTAGDSTSINLVQSGTYEVIVDGNSDATGAYSFILSQSPALPLETSIDVSGAIDLEFNAPMSVSLNPSEVKTYKFDGAIGQKVWLDGLNTTNPEVTVELLNASGDRIGSTSYLTGDIELKTLSETGEYYLVLRSDNAAPTTANFQLLDNAGAEERDLNLTPEGIEFSGNFGSTGRESLLYKFTGDAGQRLYFDRTDGDSWNKYSLYAPNGKKIVEPTQFSSSNELDELPSDGEYILVFDGNGGSNKNFNLRIVTTEPASPESLTIGNIVEGEITSAGQQNIYEFEGTANQTLWFDSLTATSNINTTLLSPTEDVVWSSKALNSDLDPKTLTTLDETGTYRLVVDGSNANIGSYSFRILDIASAKETTTDANIEGNFDELGLNESGRETHLYRFTGSEGQQLYFDRSEGYIYNSYYLYAPDGRQLFSSRLDLDTEGTTTILPGDGEYTLILSGKGYSNSNYALNIVTPEFETNPLEIGKATSGDIGEAGEKDIYTFTGNIGQQLWFDSLQYPSYNITASLLTPSGRSSFKPFGTPSVNSDNLEPITLDEAGTYTLTVDASLDNTGSYEFRLLDLARGTYLGDVSNSPEITGLFDPNLDNRDTQIYRFSGSEGQQLYFDSLEGDRYNRYYLYDRHAKQLFVRSLNADEENNAVLPEDGDYTLVVAGNGRSNNQYRLNILAQNWQEKSLTIGEEVHGSLDRAGDRDIYTFEGTEGQQLYFDSLIESNSNPLEVKLLDENDEDIWGTSFQYVRQDIAPFTLEKSGTYRLIVDDNDDDTDSYSFRLLDLAAATELAENTHFDGDFGSSRREAHIYRLQGTEGDRLYFDSMVGDGSNNWKLYDETGEIVTNLIPGSSNDLNKDIEVSLSATGTYTLILTGEGQSNNEYEFDLSQPLKSRESLIWGEEITGEIAENGERDSYLFDGSVGQQLYFDPINWDSDIYARLYSPNEVEVFSRNSTSDGKQVTLTEAGTYRLEIDGNKDTVGSYSFVMSDLETVTNLDVAANPEMSGQIAPGKVTHLYQFEGKPGQIVNFDLTSNPTSSLNWVLYNPNNGELAKPSLYSPDFEVALPAEGRYTLAIIGNSNNEVDYQFKVTAHTPETQTNEGLNQRINGTLTVGETHTHEFVANAGTQIIFDSLNNSSSSLRVRLLNPDDSEAFDNHYAHRDKEPFILNQTGFYELEIYPYYSWGTGDYEFQLLELPQDLNSATFNPLELGSVVDGTLSPGNETEVYSFYGNIGQELLFNGMSGTSVNATLYDDNGNKVFQRNNLSYDNELETLTRSGMYHLIISGTQTSPRDYEFQLLDFGAGTDLKFNLPNVGELASGQQGKLYKFTGSAGQRLYFDSLQGNTSNYWELFGPHLTEPINSSTNLATDFEVELSESGEYTLYIEGSSSTNPVPYSFQVFSHESQADIITPGTGEIVSNDDGSLGSFPVQLNVEDGRGGADVQSYNIRVWPDPDNTAPNIISSNPNPRYGLNQDVYQYFVEGFDADNDRLKYRLIDAPIGATINSDTGELLWVPEQVSVGQQYDFTVEVADPKGGTDRQSFTVDVHQTLGKITGAVFDDLNGNGYRDTTLIEGDNPNIVFAIDVSGSTDGNYVDWTEADLDRVGRENMGILGMEIATAIALSEQLILQGRGDISQIGVVPFSGSARILDMNLIQDEIQPFTTPLADVDENGITDLRQILNSLKAGGGTAFTPPLETAAGMVSGLSGNANLIFLSDGLAEVDPEVVDDLHSRGFNVTAFGIGAGANMTQLKKIDPEAIRVTNPQEIIDIFGGWDERYTPEPLMENVTVYLDFNENGVWDNDEPKQLTGPEQNYSILGSSPYQFTFENLLPGTYTVRQVVPNGYEETAPPTGVFVDEITVESGKTYSHLFGNHLIEAPPNSAPAFTTTPPIEPIETGASFIYHASATDADAEVLSYDLPLAPSGMAIHRETGVLSWQPTAEQTGTFNVLLRVKDAAGASDLQVFEIEVIPPNNPPVFTVPAPTLIEPQIGKAFEYHFSAYDADGDAEIAYELINPPRGATIDAETGILRWTPTQTGNFELTVKATDSLGGETFQNINATVVEQRPNTPPEITATPRGSARIGSQYLYQLPVTDSDGDPLSFNLLELPTGMAKDDKNRLVWTPTPEQFGSHTISLEINDGEDTTEVNWTVDVSNTTVNRAPTITSTPNLITNLERVYQYQLEAIDPDGDLLLWTLDAAPDGMVVDPESGMLSWQPTSDQIGNHTIQVQVADSGGLFVGQEFELTVRGLNTPPAIVSTPGTIGAVGQEYSYQVTATDPENDPLRYSLGLAPSGMEIDAETGLVTWTPTEGQAGNGSVEVIVIDEQDGVNRQTFTIEVATAEDAPVQANRAPVITSTAPYLAATGVPYTYQIEATDADGDALVYELIKPSSSSGLPLSKRDGRGIYLDTNTGLLTWNNPTVGSHQIVVGVNDGQVGAAQAFTLTVQDDLPPVIDINNVPSSAAPNKLYRYDISAYDPNGTTLTYQLDDNSLALGMTVDELGRLSWTPTVSQVGIHPVTIEVTDELGTTTSQTFNLTVSGDTESPSVNLIPSNVFVVDGNFEMPLGDEVTLFTNATDNIGVSGVQLFINDVPVALDANGTATWTPTELGVISAKAVAYDAAGNSGESLVEIRVYNPNDTEAPIVELSPALGLEPITAPTDIIGKVTDDNLVNYKLQIAPVSGGTFTTIAEGTDSIANGNLGLFDPTTLQNDSYILRLEATDGNNNTSSTEQIVEVTGELKLGNFRLSFTDLEIPVAGIPISVTRTYDTLTAKSQDDFGYGWRLEFRDTDLRTNVGEDELYEQTGIASVGFKDDTRVYVTLPGGKRTGFTFKPVIDPEIYKALRMGAPLPQSMIFYNPAFETDDGEQVTLSAPKTQLLLNQNTGQYYHPSGTPYNPANSFFGGTYTLTTKEGIEYKIDGQSGDLLTVTDTNGNTLSYSDEGIVSSTGQSVTFERNAAGQIVAAVDPEGNKIQYEYDENGDLVAVTDREENTTRFEYHEERIHYLEEVIDPLGRSGVRSEYDESGRLSKMLDVNGEAVELVYDPDNSTQTVLDQFGNPTTYVYDGRGNVVTEVDALGLVTQRTYDEDNNVLTETVITEESGPDGWTTTRTYDAEGNKLSETDPLGDVSRWTYNNLGRVLTETNPLGETTTNTYDGNGNLLSTKDAEGNVTDLSYDGRGNVLSSTDANNETTQLRYDQFGNVVAVIDPFGNETTYTYNLRGDRLTETRFVTTPDGVEEITTKSEYDSEGRLKSSTDAENQTTEYRYDANDNQIAVIDALGRRTETRYDAKGQLIEIIYPDSTPNNPNDNPRTISVYDKGGRQRATIDEGGQVTHYKYDASGRQIEAIYPDGTDTFEQFIQAVAPGETAETVDWTQVVYPEEAPTFLTDNPRTLIEYDRTGRTKANIDERGNRTEYRYDALGQLLETIYPDDTSDNIADNPRTTSQYDASGRQIASIDALGRTTKFIYDELGRPTETHFADGTKTKTIYDSVGRRIASIDQAGNKTEYEYDPWGRLTDVVQFLDPNGENKEIRTEYGYDELGRLIWTEDANDHRTNDEYDKLSRRTAVILPEGQRSETTYDAVGNVNTEKDFNGEITAYRYDEQNRQVLIDLPNDPDITFTYTPTGNRETVTDGRGTTSYFYDARNRLTSRTDPTGPYLSSGATIEYEYDAAGNRTFLRTPGGFISYEFDEQNRLDTAIDSSQGTTTYIYDAVSNLVETVLPNGVVETRRYDQLNRLEYLENELGETVISSYDYEVDEVGNRLSVTEHGGRKVEYEYDSLYRLVSEKISDPSNPDRTIAYSYDNVGNRLSRNDSVEGQTTYQYNDNDWLLEERNNGEIIVYEYDNNGNTIKRVKNGTEETVYVWDDLNRLIEVRTPSGDIITYTYDVDNIRVSETVNGVTTQYIVDKNRDYAQVIEEYVDGELEVRYVHGLDLISQERNEEVSVYLVDGLGSTRVLTDDDGSVTNVYDYDAFGNLISNSGNIENNYQFAGEQLDENLEQYYLRQRYYDAGIGRFTRRDTYEGRLQEPITLHKYLYGNANPVNFTDPTGLFSLSELNSAITLVGVLANSYGFVSNFNSAVNAENNSDRLLHSIDAGWNLVGLAFPFIRPGSGGFSASTGAVATYSANIAKSIGSVLIPTGQIVIGQLVVLASRNPHHAEWELRGGNNELIDSGEMLSGSDTPPGRRLNWNEQLLTHTERKILKLLEHRVKKGDIITMRGTLAPCNISGGRGCQPAMQEFAKKHSVTVIYYQQGNSSPWIFTP